MEDEPKNGKPSEQETSVESEEKSNPKKTSVEKTDVVVCDVKNSEVSEQANVKKSDKIINLFVGCVTTLIFVYYVGRRKNQFLKVTLLSAFLSHTPPRGLNIYFALCISLIGLGHLLLIYWYRQGDLHPKFRLLIYYNAFTVVLLSICALSFFFTEK